MSKLLRFMSFENPASSYIIKLRNCLNKIYRLAIPFAENNFGPFGRIFFVRNRLVPIAIKNTTWSVICKPVSSNLHLLSRYFHFYHGICVSITSLSCNKCWIYILCSFFKTMGLPIPDK